MLDLLLRSAWTFIYTFVVLCLLLAAAVAVLSDPGGTIVPLFNGIVLLVKIALGAIALGVLVLIFAVVRYGWNPTRAGAQAAAQEASSKRPGHGRPGAGGDTARANTLAAEGAQSQSEEESIDDLLDEFRRDFPEIDFGNAEDYALESESGTTVTANKTVIVKKEGQETDGKPSGNNRKITITIERGGG